MIHVRMILMLMVFSMVFLAGDSNVLAEELGTIELLKPQLERGALLMQALKERRSERQFSSKELSLELISNLLWAASGVNRLDSGNLTAPTAKNSQEIGIYVAMEKGLYLYNAQKHTLEPIMAKDVREFTGLQSFTQIAPINLIYVADFSKMGGRNEGTIFYSATDTGFISQNVYLFCASEGLSTVVLGWVDKPALSKAMNLRDDQGITLTQPVGYPK
ncbi:nitroreductase family protein [Candidatus Omnitrophota bacterium]